MRFLKKFKIFEREFSQEWFDRNPDNYVVKNNHVKNNKVKLNSNDKTERKWLSEISYKDITITEGMNGQRREKYICTYINKEYFINDRRLMEFIVEKENFNRIHTAWGGQLNPTLRNIGLGYKCYKAVINHVGWVRSSEEGTNENSRRIWKSLIKDPDYWVFEILETDTLFGECRKNEFFLNKESRPVPGFIIFKKDMDKNEINKIVDDFTKEGNEIVSTDFKK